MAYFIDGQQNQVLAVSLTTYIIKNRVLLIGLINLSVHKILFYTINFVMVSIMHFSDNFYYFVREMLGK